MPTEQIFIRRTKKDMPESMTVASIFGHRVKKGEVGIEVEVEGNKFPKTDSYGSGTGAEYIPKQWKYTKDGSLRGKDNAEYILKQPILFTKVDQAIDDLWDMFDKYGSKLDDSNRTSVHVHLNVQTWHLDRVTSFLGLYFAVEELLTQWCGEHRVGNLFCLRARDATAIVSKIKGFIQSDGQGPYLSEGLHYAGLNCQAMQKFGSIEIRSLRGCTDKETLKTWVGILQRLYEISETYNDPRDVVEGFSGNGPLAFLEKILGPFADEIIQNSGYSGQQIMEAMYDGIRHAQDICYCRDWENFKRDRARPSPFGVKKRKVAASTGSAPSAATIYNSLLSQPFTSAPQVSVSDEEFDEIMEAYDDDDDDY